MEKRCGVTEVERPVDKSRSIVLNFFKSVEKVSGGARKESVAVV